MSDERAEYLASATGAEPDDRDHLDLIRDILGQEATWAEPPPEVADHFLAAIGSDKVNELDPNSSPPTESHRWGWAAAAVGGIAALVVGIYGLLGVFAPADTEIIAIEGTELQPSATGQAEIRETDAGWWIRLDVDRLPASEVGTYYEGWLWNEEGEGVSIGTFHLHGGDEPVILWSGVDPADYPAIWVTLEKEDGDPSASDTVVMRGRPDES